MFEQFISRFLFNANLAESLLCQHSTIGDRTCNEDAHGYKQIQLSDGVGHFLIVCDGMGGHVAGDITSKALVDAFIEQIDKFEEQLTPITITSVYEKAVAQMQQYIKGNHGDVDGHTTLSCAWLDNTQVITLHVGDSRVYQLNSKEVLWRTRDHSVVQMLLDEGDITEEEMGTHPDQNKLFKSISVLGEKVDKPSVKKHPPLTAGDSLLVCSDGFWEFLTPKELVKLSGHLTQATLEEYCTLSQRRAAGKSDNITVLMYKKGMEG